MHADLLDLAAWVIKQSSRDRPADAVLRLELKNERGLTAEDRAEVSRAVFAYYRWLGWLGKGIRPRQAIGPALELAARFSRDPSSFSDQELIERVAPGWAAQEVEVTSEWARALQREPRLWLRARP